MIIIEPSKDGKAFVKITGYNNETLMVSETLESNQAIWKNISATSQQLSSLDPYQTIIDRRESPAITWVLDTRKVIATQQ